MGKLLRYLDNNYGCWSRVDLSNGDPIWISVARTGAVVKRSRMGIFGAKLYRESNVYKIAKTSELLGGSISEFTIPADITNPVLRAFTQVILECVSAAQVAMRLNDAGRGELRIDSKQTTDGKAQHRVDIVAAFGSCIENNPGTGEIRDLSELPYPKQEILDALCLEIIRAHSDDQVEVLKAGAMMLAEYQDNIGATPLTMLGEGASALLNNESRSDGDLEKLIDALANNSDSEKYQEARNAADRDLVNIQNKLVAAELLREKMPAEHRRRILG